MSGYTAGGRAASAAEPRLDVWLLGALYTVELSALFEAVALNRYYNLLGGLSIRQMIVLAGPATVCLAGASLVVLRAQSAWRQGRTRGIAQTLALNAAAVILCAAGGELVVRLFSIDDVSGRSFAGTTLLPRSWEEVKARNAALLDHAPSSISYLVDDPALGWAPGSDRRSADGLYFSSVEGIRSPGSGVAYTATAAPRRVAILGDSFTFGLEVPFEQTWGSMLEQSLGPGVSVLDFGVDGYGVDQTFLRYERDARPWRPEVAIFGYINHDLTRAVSVYTFLTFPEWEFPFSKPRFVLRGTGQLELLNPHVESPMELLQRESIDDLPYLEYEPGYNPDEWTGHFYDVSYLARFAFSRYPRWPPADTVDLEAGKWALGTELVLAFAKHARMEGSFPIVVRFPSKDELENPGVLRRDLLPSVRQAGVEAIDMTPCVGPLGVERAFNPGGRHYSAEGNAAVVGCLLSVVRERLGVD